MFCLGPCVLALLFTRFLFSSSLLLTAPTTDTATALHSSSLAAPSTQRRSLSPQSVWLWPEMARRRQITTSTAINAATTAVNPAMTDALADKLLLEQLADKLLLEHDLDEESPG